MFSSLCVGLGTLGCLLQNSQNTNHFRVLDYLFGTLLNGGHQIVIHTLVVGAASFCGCLLKF